MPSRLSSGARLGGMIGPQLQGGGTGTRIVLALSSMCM